MFTVILEGNGWQSAGYNYLLQFTLYTVLKGNKPDFHTAMGGEQSEAFYKDFLQQLGKAYKPDLIKGNKMVRLEASSIFDMAVGFNTQ